MYKVIVEWETDGEVVDNLPTIVGIPADVRDEDIAEWLSNTYGWLVLNITDCP